MINCGGIVKNVLDSICSRTRVGDSYEGGTDDGRRTR